MGAGASTDLGAQAATDCPPSPKQAEQSEGLVTELQDSTSIELRDVHLECCVGRGGYASVWRGYWMSTLVAVKLLHKGENDYARLVRKIGEEKLLLQRLRHPNVCCFYGTCSVRMPGVWEVGLVLEYLGGGTLNTLLNLGHEHRIGDGPSPEKSPSHEEGGHEGGGNESHAAIPSAMLVQLAVDVAAGLHFLHSQHVCHGDVKSRGSCSAQLSHVLSAPVH